MNTSLDSANQLDVVVIGGGAAGLSGALMLARSRRSVLVIDSGQPRNAPAEGVHGLLARDGIPPDELLKIGRDEVQKYGGQIIDGEVIDTRRSGTTFLVTLAGGKVIQARRLLVTTGLVDRLPDIPGLAEQWGKNVVHCPYCHGWEVRNRRIGVLASSPMSVHQASLFRQLTDDLIYFTHESQLTAEQETEFAARGITVVMGRVTSVDGNDDHITGVRMADGRVIPREVIAVATKMEARADFLAGLGLKSVEHPSGVGHYFPSDATGRSEVEGVWLAGNVTDMSAQVGAAAAAAAMAGAVINADLVTEDTQRAVEIYLSAGK